MLNDTPTAVDYAARLERALEQNGRDPVLLDRTLLLQVLSEIRRLKRELAEAQHALAEWQAEGER